MQMRVKEGVDKRWFNPSRDLVNCWPALMRSALQAQDDFQGNIICDREQMLACGGALGKLLANMIKTPIMPDEAQAQLKEICTKYPGAMAILEHAAFQIFHGVWAAWLMDAKPKTVGDAEIPTYGLDEIMDKIARAARK